MSRLDALFKPVYAGGWVLTRVLWAFVAVVAHAPRARGIGDAYAAPDFVVEDFLIHLNRYVILSEEAAWGLWGVALLAALAVGVGGRWMRPGLLVWLPTYWIFLCSEALNMKAYDRLLTWIALALFISPAAEKGLTAARRSPVARWFLILVFCALYGSTGWLKALEEPLWFTSGDVLAQHLLHNQFGRGAWSAWWSAQTWFVWPAAIFTVLAEASFPFLVWWRRTNAWTLAALALMHLGIVSLMDVGPFSWVALAAYPVLLHPELAQRWAAGLGSAHKARQQRP